MKRFLKFAIIISLSLILTLNISTLPQVKATQPAINLVKQGKQYYDSGKYSQAVEKLQQAAQTYENIGNLINQAQVYNWMSLAYQQLGKWDLGRDTINKSLSLLDAAPKDNQQVRAQILNSQGRLQLMMGETELALETWETAEKLYQKGDDEVGAIGAQINQAEALQVLGFYHRARNLFERIENNLYEQSDSSMKVLGLRNLGNLLRQAGNLEKSENVLNKALEIANKLDLNREKSLILLSLGNTLRTIDKNTTAHNYYQQAENIAAKVSPTIKTEAQLNRLSLLIENNQWQDAINLSINIPEPLQNLPLSRSAVYAQVNLAQNLICLQYQNSNCLIKEDLSNQDKQNLLSKETSKIKEIELLNTAIAKAKELQDERVKSYALGNLGRLYETLGETSIAQNYTQQALQISQQIQAAELDYQWFWQTGRLFKQQGDIEKATAAYLNAVDSLQLIRRDLVVLSPDIRFDFRDEVETVYRQTVKLLLQPRNNKKISQENLKKARYIIESLQLAELDNFFNSACLQPKVELDEVVDGENATAAVIYPILLDKQIEIILKLPQQSELKHYTIAADKQQIENTIAQLQQYLLDVSATTQVKKYSQELYNSLIQPIQADLKNNKIRTLVFVLDDSLRNIPMAVLYDKTEKKYLLQEYSIALTPGLQLVKPKPLRQVRLNALIAGVKEQRVIEGREFAALPNLEREVTVIKSQISKNQELINQKFTKTNLQNKIKSLPFSIVHLATHGQFSSNPEETFIMTWDKLLKVNELDNLLRTRNNNSETIELLVLSACQTALGDSRAALGLAGVAVRAGARSTLATLWAIDDESTTDFMSEFYQELNQGINKAQAIQNAQLKIFETEKRPYFWAPYVLVGNWL